MIIPAPNKLSWEVWLRPEKNSCFGNSLKWVFFKKRGRIRQKGENGLCLLYAVAKIQWTSSDI